MSRQFAESGFVCLNCQALAAFGGTCASCDGCLVSRTELPPWELRGRLDTRPALTARGLVRYGLGFVLMFAFIAWSATDARTAEARQTVLMLALIFAAITFSQLVQGTILARRWRREQDALLRPAGAPDAAIAIGDAGDGAVVRVRGIVRTLKATFDSDGERCAAFRVTQRINGLAAPGSEQGPGYNVHARGGGSVRISLFDGTLTRETRGGLFAVEAPSGAVIVRGEHLLCAADGAVRDGDEVTVVGRVHREESADAANYRVPSPVPVIRGSADAPIVLHKLRAESGTGSTGVRAAGASPSGVSDTMPSSDGPEQGERNQTR